MKKLLIITYYWTPCGGAGVQRWLKFCKYLPEFGVEPVVLTVKEEQASYPQIDSSLDADVSPNLRVVRTNTRELYNIYKRFSPQKEIPYGGFSNEKKPNLFQKISRFVRGNFFLPDPRRGWNRFAFRRACEIIEKEQIQTVITTSPPHSTQLIGRKLKKQYPHIKWIADMRDPYTDIYYYKDLYPTRLATAINKYYERKILTEADRVLTVSEDLKRIFEGKISNCRNAAQHVSTDRIFVIPNGYDEEDFVASSASVTEPLSTSATGESSCSSGESSSGSLRVSKGNDKFVVTYTGTMSDVYDISGLLAAIRHLPEKERERIHLRFVGNISPDIIQQIKENGLSEKTEFIPYVPHKESIAFLRKSDLLLLVIAKTERNKGIVTGKIFEYLASETPILCLAPTDGDAAKIIEECRAGRTFDYADEAGIADFLVESGKWRVESGEWRVENEAKIYQKYSRKKLTELLVDIL
jgi:glycosyltransferase involved in cell wall biosynthesis